MTAKIPILIKKSTGIFAFDGLPDVNLLDNFTPIESNVCRAMLFSSDGSYFAYVNGTTTVVLNTNNWQTTASIPNRKPFYLAFSPTGSYLLSWTSYISNDKSGDNNNLQVHKTVGGEYIKGFVQKKQTNWEPALSKDEKLFSLLLNGQISFYENFQFDSVINKLSGQKILTYSISPNIGTYFILCHVQSKSSGQPSSARLYKYPNFGERQEIAVKTFFQADNIDYLWNSKGNHVLLLTSTDVDVTGSSYYGKQGLFYFGINGNTSNIILSKEGPIHSVQWSPKNQEFCVIYGFMPAKATIFNLNCEPIFEIGTGHRNSIYFNPHGNILLICGFGNLPGSIDIWDAKKKKKIGECIAANSTVLEWSSDGEHFLTATTAPRLRIDNGFKIWHYSGSLLHEHLLPEGEQMTEVMWKPYPKLTFSEPEISDKKVESIVSSQPQVSTQAYRPPGARNRPVVSDCLHRDDETPHRFGGYGASSKHVSKNKKKRDARKAKQLNDPLVDVNVPKPIGNVVNITLTGDCERDKKLRNIKKKLDSIEKLKQEQAEGKILQINQLEKIKGEAQLRLDLEKLTL